MASGDVTNIASGFYEDCVKLMDKFKCLETIRFGSFCEVWKEMKFSLVFVCRKTYAESFEFCEESLNIAKQFAILSNDFSDQIAGLYLLYSLYYKKPIQQVKIRVTLREWQQLLNLHHQIKDEKLHDASFIFVKLVTENAFHHCLFKTEYGLEKNFKSRQEYTFDNPHSILPSIINELESGELVEIQKLSKTYEEQKTKYLNQDTKKLQLFDENFMDEIINDIETLQNKRQEMSGLRKKSKELSIQKKTDRSKYNFEDKIRPKLGHGFDTDSSDDENMDNVYEFQNSDKNLSKSFDQNDDDSDERSQNESYVKIDNFTTKQNDLLQEI